MGEHMDKTIDAMKKDDIKGQINQLREEIAEVTDNIKNYGSENVKDKLSDFYYEAKHKGAESYNEARDRFYDLQDHLSEEVRRKPLSSLAIAAGVGFVAALLTRR
ncbi:DUF883 domain-containing protein [Bartonella sp. TP]|uniref:DUF883 family protein n=1 Tax=Bartonella sp. TP TaxID=3057550 RepID=UPI0025B10AF9|nr:DUF883 domain-containing protein [Bartonella sp. TP]WJW79627.1 DUF883 domain-containing protein [Bartonella sp. TP]